MYVASNSGALLGLHVKWPIFIYDCDQIWSVSTDFLGRPQYQISRKSPSESRVDTVDKRTDTPS